ncbi:hypothetical protein MMUR_21740 [Mycolicibacterium murale]|uniref:DUF732 domain-containing protein n=1 Tax=Mycolicibacterium murale TaxID=182220 RepID=A0A7I9WL04_9MYCO|nr:DUF732 domain-containing protein [Mycolicibacterium murale]MCV7185624.1 DUF732 domain-containing protein [Mycolicibacterium murale]GFG58038.1 hypothetical protein MMUR_21740 [Mycolicibacterium murale]
MALIKSFSVTTALFAAAFSFAAPATADDQMFADALDMIGVSVGDPAAVGRGVCASFDAGQTLPAVVDQLSAAHGITVDDASMVAGFSVAEYCDHHEGALTLG